MIDNELIEEGTKILMISLFKVFEITEEKIKKNKISLYFDYSITFNGRKKYEQNKYDSNKIFESLINNIKSHAKEKKKIHINGPIPVPFYVALGAHKKFALNLKSDKNQSDIWTKILVKNNFGKKKVELIQKKRIPKKPTLVICESKDASNEKYDFLIKNKKNKFKRNNFGKKSLIKCINKFMSEINKRSVKEINISIIASPSVAFLVGKILADHNYIFNIFHYSILEEKNIIKGKLGPDINIKLF